MLKRQESMFIKTLDYHRGIMGKFGLAFEVKMHFGVDVNIWQKRLMIVADIDEPEAKHFYIMHFE